MSITSLAERAPFSARGRLRQNLAESQKSLLRPLTSFGAWDKSRSLSGPCVPGYKSKKLDKVVFRRQRPLLGAWEFGGRHNKY